MAIPFTVEQFYGVFRDYNTAVWPTPWFLVAMALAALIAVLGPRPWSGVVVSAVLGVLWAWIALAYHLIFFARLPLRQCTRGGYDGLALSSEELALLQRAGSSDTVRLLLLLTDRPAMPRSLRRPVEAVLVRSTRSESKERR